MLTCPENLVKIGPVHSDMVSNGLVKKKESNSGTYRIALRHARNRPGGLNEAAPFSNCKYAHETNIYMYICIFLHSTSTNQANSASHFQRDGK